MLGFLRNSVALSLVSCEPNVPAVILTTDTEVVIAPKTRNAPPPSSKAKQKPTLKPVAVPKPVDENDSATPATKPTLRILPTAFFNIASIPQDSQTTIWVSPGTFKAIARIPKVDPANVPETFVSVRRLKPPATISTVSGPGSPTPSTANAKVLHGTQPNVPIEPKAESDLEKQSICRLRCFAAIPDRHACVVMGSSGDADGAADWDVIR